MAKVDEKARPITLQDDTASQKASSLIKVAVLSKMGTPPGYITTRVCHLWAKNYRVNVFAAKQDPNALVANGKIVDSFFVTVDDDNEITKSDPLIPVLKYPKNV